MINKYIDLSHSIGDFGGYHQHMIRQQSILPCRGLVPSVYGVKPFGVVYINKKLWAPNVYNDFLPGRKLWKRKPSCGHIECEPLSIKRNCHPTISLFLRQLWGRSGSISSQAPTSTRLVLCFFAFLHQSPLIYQLAMYLQHHKGRYLDLFSIMFSSWRTNMEQ